MATTRSEDLTREERRAIHDHTCGEHCDDEKLTPEQAARREEILAELRTRVDARTTTIEGTLNTTPLAGEPGGPALANTDAWTLADDDEREMMHERAHAGMSDPDTCKRDERCPVYNAELITGTYREASVATGTANHAAHDYASETLCHNRTVATAAGSRGQSASEIYDRITCRNCKRALDARKSR